MDISEKELFEIIGRQQAQILLLTKQLKAHQARAVELQKQIEEASKGDEE